MDTFVLPDAGTFRQMASEQEDTHSIIALHPTVSSPPMPTASPESSSDHVDWSGSPPPSAVPALTADDLEAVRKVVGPTISVLASVVAKLYLCPATSSEYRWSGHWGACVLVVDRTPPSSRHIQLYTMHQWERVLNIQLYQDMVYLAPNHLFHTFEIENALVGLSFGNLKEAQEFLVKAHGSVPTKTTTKKPGLLARLFGGGSSEPNSSPGARDISTPTSVVHTAHAGFDAATGSLAQRDLPPEWHSLFSNAQVALMQSKQQQAAVNAGIQRSPSSGRSDSSPYLSSSPLPAEDGRNSHTWAQTSSPG